MLLSDPIDTAPPADATYDQGTSASRSVSFLPNRAGNAQGPPITVDSFFSWAIQTRDFYSIPFFSDIGNERIKWCTSEVNIDYGTV